VTAPRPFASTPGRDSSRDCAETVDIAGYYYDQRFRLAEDAPIFRRLIEAVGWPNDLGSAPWAQWYSVALGFAPDLIVELGRGFGNSTALFTQAAARLESTRVVSLCLTSEWFRTVAPRIAGVVGARWFDRLDARRVDILSVDYDRLFGDHRRVLLLWDAHGFEIAELVLGEMLPRLANRAHLVLMHDISDNRYAGISRSYQGDCMWRGSRWRHRRGDASRVNIGWMNSEQDQVIALADFAARNDLEIGSADDVYSRRFPPRSPERDEMSDLLGPEFFSVIGHWAFLSLSGRQGPFHFPAVGGARGAVHRSPIVADRRTPFTVTTEAVPWAYASTLDWRPKSEPPPDRQGWLKCRIRVEGGAVGVALLTRDESAFVDAQLVGGSPDSIIVVLNVPKAREERGRLVIHTAEAPESARVVLEELALVW